VVRVRPVTPEALVAELAERIGGTAPAGWLRVVVDGAPPTRPGSLAASLVDPLRALGRPVLTVSAHDFLRPASLRLEHGHTDPESFYTSWLDVGALRREVLDPLEPGGTGRVLPSLWDAGQDRATRADYVALPPGGVLLLSGELLLGQGLPADLTVHLLLTPAALTRQLDEAQHWTLPAYHRYTAEADPEALADVVVRLDNPDRPALQTR
jgi:hypothetical protein